MRAPNPRRGSVMVVSALALVALVAVSLAAAAALVAGQAKRVSHQRDGLQALYLAEMGIEEALTLAAGGEAPEMLRRTVERSGGDDATVGGGEEGNRSIVDAADSRLVVGRYEVVLRETGQVLEARSRGMVVTPAGMSVVRTVEVSCRREGSEWRVESWRQVP